MWVCVCVRVVCLSSGRCKLTDECQDADRQVHFIQKMDQRNGHGADHHMKEMHYVCLCVLEKSIYFCVSLFMLTTAGLLSH